MTTTATTRAEAIANALATIADSRAQLAAVSFPVGAYVVAATSGAVMTLTILDDGTVKFACTNTPRAWGKETANKHARRWNAEHGVAHPVHVLSADKWLATRHAECDESERFIRECEADAAK